MAARPPPFVVVTSFIFIFLHPASQIPPPHPFFSLQNRSLQNWHALLLCVCGIFGPIELFLDKAIND